MLNRSSNTTYLDVARFAPRQGDSPRNNAVIAGLNRIDRGPHPNLYRGMEEMQGGVTKSAQGCIYVMGGVLMITYACMRHDY